MLAAADIPEAASELAILEKQLSPQELAEACYLTYHHLSSGVVRDKVRAAALLKKSAELGLAQAQDTYARALKFGLNMPKDETASVQWFQKAAMQNRPSSMYMVALAYESGSGVAKDPAQALVWYRKGAEAGNPSSQFKMGEACEKGVLVAQDFAEAAKWFRRAADHGNASAAVGMARCYRFGKGVPVDLVEAAKWAEIAVRQLKSKSHEPFLNSIRGQLTPEQQKKATDLAYAWKEQPPPHPERRLRSYNDTYSGPKKVSPSVGPVPDLGSPVVVIPVALTKDGRGLLAVSQVRNPDPLTDETGGLLDTMELWNTTTLTRMNRSAPTGASHVAGVPSRSGGLPGPFMFSPDNRMITAGADNKGIILYQVPSLQQIGPLVLPGKNGDHFAGSLNNPCAAFSRAGDSLFTALRPGFGGDKGGGQLWKLSDRTLIREFTIPGYKAALCLSPDEKLLATAEYGNRVHLLDAVTGQLLAEYHPQMGILNAVSMHPAGDRVAFAGEGGAAMLYVDRQGPQLRLIRFSPLKFSGYSLQAGGIRSIAFSPDGRLLATADSYDHVVRVFDAETLKAVGVLPQLGSGPVLFSPDSKGVWVAGLDAPWLFPIARFEDQGFQDQLAITAGGDLLHWAFERIRSKGQTSPETIAARRVSLYRTDVASAQAMGVLNSRSTEATILVARLLDLPGQEYQGMAVLALASIGPETLRQDPTLSAKLKAHPNQETVSRLMPWLRASP